jgi:Na+-driven multidrug efflux pump
LNQDDSNRVEHLIRDAELEELEDPEASPSLPAAALVARAALRPTADPAVETEDTYGEIWRIAWPVVLAQLLVNLVSLIDVAMLGHISSQALTAVGYATQFFFLVQSVLLAIGFACVALMARAIGAGDWCGRHIHAIPGVDREQLGASRPTAVLVAYVLRADLAWVWAVILFDHVVRSAWLAVSFRRGRWRSSAGAAPRVALTV